MSQLSSVTKAQWFNAGFKPEQDCVGKLLAFSKMFSEKYDETVLQGASQCLGGYSLPSTICHHYARHLYDNTHDFPSSCNKC